MSRTPNQLAGQHRRRLRAIKRKLEDMAAEWADVDAYNEGELANLAETLEDVGQALKIE